MAEKKAKYTSKGERRNVAKRSLVKNDNPLTNELNKWNAFVNGKKVFFTIDNPNPNETNKRKIRVEGKTLYGDFRKYNDFHIIK